MTKQVVRMAVPVAERNGARRPVPRAGVEACTRARCRFEEAALALTDQVYDVARALAGSRAEAEVLLEEGYARAFRRWRSFAEEGDMRRRLECIVTEVHEERRQTAGQTRPVAAAADGPRPCRDALVTVLSTLPPAYRRSYLLVAVGGFDHSETARVLGLPTGVVVSCLGRVRRILERELARSSR